MSSYLTVGHVPELHILHYIASTITVTVLQNNTIGIQGWMDGCIVLVLVHASRYTGSIMLSISDLCVTRVWLQYRVYYPTPPVLPYL